MSECWAARQKMARDKRKREREGEAVPTITPTVPPSSTMPAAVCQTESHGACKNEFAATPSPPCSNVAQVGTCALVDGAGGEVATRGVRRDAPVVPTPPPCAPVSTLATHTTDVTKNKFVATPSPPCSNVTKIVTVTPPPPPPPLLPVPSFQPVPGMSWTERYRPQSMSDVAGNGKAKQLLVKWARAGVWKEPVLIAGPVGVGKTSVAHALCRDMGWVGLDCQSLPGEVLATVEQVLFRKQPGNVALILDEVDEWPAAERTKLVQLLKHPKRNMLPVVCVAEDVGRNLDTLKRMCTLVRMSKFDMRDAFTAMVRRLKVVTERTWTPRMLQQVEKMCGLDLRRAVVMLEMAAQGGGSIGGESDLFVDSLFDAAECILSGHPRQLSGVENSQLFKQHDLMLWMLHENALNRQELLDLPLWLSDMDFLDAHRSHALHDYPSALSGHLFASLEPPFLRVPPLKFPAGLGAMSQHKSMSNVLAEHRVSYDDWFLLAPVADDELERQRRDKKAVPRFLQHWCTQAGYVAKDLKKVVADHGTLSYLPGDKATLT